MEEGSSDRRADRTAYVRRCVLGSRKTATVSQVATDMIAEVYRVVHVAKGRRLPGGELVFHRHTADPQGVRFKVWLDEQADRQPP